MGRWSLRLVLPDRGAPERSRAQKCRQVMPDSRPAFAQLHTAAKVQVSRCRAGSVLVAACHSPCEAWPAWAVSLPTVQGNSAGPQKAASAHPHGLAAASAPECLATQHCRHARSHRQPSDWPGGSGRQCLFRAHRASAAFSSCCAVGTAPACASCAQ